MAARSNAMDQKKPTIRIGGGSGYWGESDMALPQFLAAGDVDYVAFDYLAEITMSIMARAQQKSPDAGYAADFVTDVIGPNLEAISRTRTKILSNAGGLNPRQCAAEIRKHVNAAGLDLKVAVVVGDNLTDRADAFGNEKEMFTGEAFPDPSAVASINAYLGAFPVAEALKNGADIVITGRCADSALALAACIHKFGWGANDWNLLAAGSLAGHIIECGPQASGGNFTDWKRVEKSLANVGYPIAEINAQGEIIITKPEGTGGEVSFATVAEQMLYEIGDPRAYELPDVVCDFSSVEITDMGDDRAAMSGAIGSVPSSRYKASATFADGWKIATLWFFIGEDAHEKSLSFADAAFLRTRRKLKKFGAPDFSETLAEPFGSESHYGAFAKGKQSREVGVKIAAKHADPRPLGLLLKETTGLALAAPPGLTMFSGGRPKPSPVVRLFSLLVEKTSVDISIEIDDARIPFHPAVPNEAPPPAGPAPQPSVPGKPADMPDLATVSLRTLAWARSGDKGDKANIGVIPRRAEFTPWIWTSITKELVAERFAHFLKGPVERFFLPGTGAINFLLHDVLGGGGIASLRNDPQGKSYAQILLDTPVELPRSLLEAT